MGDLSGVADRRAALRVLASPRKAGLVVVAVAAALLGVATAASAEFTPATPRGFGGGSCCCDSPVDCGSFCCGAGETCNQQAQGCCPAGSPIACAHTCCAANESCGADGFTCVPACPFGSATCGPGRCCGAGSTCNPLNPDLCCPAGLPVACAFTCCPAGSVCSADGTSCGTTCPGGFPEDCGNGFCCPAANTCNTIDPAETLCCPAGFPRSCLNGCCPSSSTCNPVNPQLCCSPGFPVPCQNTCCPAGHQCSADGGSCVLPNPCTDPHYPVNCGGGYCCPFGDRCAANVQIADVIYSHYCCIDLPAEGCCPSVGSPALSQGLGSTMITNSTRGGSGAQCRKSTKVRPFDVLQVSATSVGAPGSFDVANHEYSVGFKLKGKKGHEVVLKVPIIPEDSDSTTLAVMIPPFMGEKSNGKAEIFIVTDGVMSETCLSTVRIAKLPKSASKVTGLVTHSWLRANQTAHTTARPSLGSAAAAPFVNGAVLADVDSAIANVGTLVSNFAPSAGVAKGELAKTARHADSLVTGILAAGQRVGDPAFAAASQGLLQAMSQARDPADPSLKAAETNYATTILNASGPSAQSVAKFTNACGAVTTAGVGASAVSIAGGATASAGVDAKAAATAICGATISVTTTVCGVTSVVAGASSPGTGRTAYGKTLLRGAARLATATRINYGGINLGSAKICGCRKPRLKGVVDVTITIIVIVDRVRGAAPRICFPDVPAEPAPGAVSHCNEEQVAGGDTPDTRTIELGRTGTATFDFNTYSKKDRIVVRYQGGVLLDTGCVGTSGSPSLTYSGPATQVTVEVIPNCDDPTTGTVWDYTVHCPS